MTCVIETISSLATLCVLELLRCLSTYLAHLNPWHHWRYTNLLVRFIETQLPRIISESRWHHLSDLLHRYSGVRHPTERNMRPSSTILKHK